MDRSAEITHGLDARAAGRLRAVARGCALFAAALGAAALSSYPLHLPWLRALGAPIEMQPNAAAGILLAAAAVFVRRYGPWGARAAGVLGAAAAAIGLATLVEHATGLDLGIDRRIVPDIGPSRGASSPGRMGPPSALNLFVAGVAVGLLGARRRGVRFVAQGLALGILAVPLVGVVGHLYGVALLYETPATTAVSFPAALALLAIDVALLCERPDSGFTSALVSGGAGGVIARRMLLYVLLVPVALGGAALALSGGGERSALPVSLLVVALSLVFALLVLRDARAMDRLEAAQLRAQEERARSREELARALAREQDARAAAEAASRARDQFLATLSHELRTPLNAILGWAGLLRDGDGDPARSARAIAVIERNGRALAQLVSDLLDVSRLAAGNMEVARSDVDLLAVVDEAVESVRGSARAKGVLLARVASGEIPRVIGDRARLQQVAWNLVSNAVKFTPSGGSVDVRVGTDGQRVVVEVRDTGIGMTPEFIPTLFDPFVQADGTSARRHGGLGIGLAITKQLVDLHGGEIEARSDGPGRGSVFRVALPAVARPAAVTGTPPPRRPDLGGARVLVVDDEADSRDVLVQLLSAWGARPAGVSSAREALESVAREPPDLVVSDIAMPDVDGFTLLRELRRIESARGSGRVPVAALTAFARSEDRQRTLAAGFDAHLAKPVEPATLLSTLSGLLRAQRGGAPAPAGQGTRAAR